MVMVPSILEFSPEQAQSLWWGPLVNGDDYRATPQVITPITDAVVKATLYLGRDPDTPEITPGTPVAGLNNLTLTHTAGGVYKGAFGGEEFAPAPGDDYVLVITSRDTLDRLEAKWQVRSRVLIRRGIDG